MTAGPLLEAKLHVPGRRKGLVTRSRLSERLRGGGVATLTLVSAPPGFGKTTLLTEWLDESGSAKAWVSLDARDNDPALFWTYVISALQRAAPETGTGALALLQSAPAPIEPVLATLLNDLDAVPHDVVLTLDDYHVIEAPEIQEGVAFLLEHLPTQVHLVIVSRADPALPLGRLRARGELVEIRAADLRFSADEAAAYLNGTMGLGLTAQDVEALEGRTEGWIAALQLAALSMQGRDDVAGFIARFAGDDRYVVDYLAGEVLARQPEDVRRFLLETSVLSRFTGSLCDAVTGQDGGKATLEALDRANLFVVPLDDRRLWYRYHHLFGDVLRARLLDEQPERVPELHRRASDWFEQDGDRAEAIRHAMAGGHFERAADLVELAAPGLSQARQDATLRGYLQALPDEVFENRPVLTIAYVGGLMVHGEVTGVEERLAAAERWLDEPSPDMVVVDEQEFRRLRGQIALYRTGLAHIAGDLPGTIRNAHRILEVVAEDDHQGRGAAEAFLALTHWALGDLTTADEWESRSVASMERAGHIADVLGCSLALADIQVGQGRLRDAMRTFEHALELAAADGDGVPRGTADMHTGLSELFRERNDLEAARQHLEASRELGEHAGLAQNAYRWRVAMARVLEAEGDLGGAVALLDEAEPLYTSDFSPPVRPVSAVKARVLVKQGEVGAALGWARERQLSAADDLTYVREYEHLTLARALLAHGSVDEASGLLDRLLAAAEEGQRTGSVIEIRALQALAHQARGDLPAVLATLEPALALAEPESYVRVFLDEGSPMAALLEAGGQGPKQTRTATQQGLIEPLSERELDVLRLLRSDLTGPEIARELIVSLNTMRTHTKHIYDKLGVNSRRAAVRRADELGL